MEVDFFFFKSEAPEIVPSKALKYVVYPTAIRKIFYWIKDQRSVVEMQFDIKTYGLWCERFP